MLVVYWLVGTVNQIPELQGARLRDPNLHGGGAH